MSSPAIRFEIRMPIRNSVPPGDNSAAYDAFTSGLAALVSYQVAQVYVVDTNNVYTPHSAIYGYITAAQSAAALALLATLNTALGTPVVCASWPVTLQP